MTGRIVEGEHRLVWADIICFILAFIVLLFVFDKVMNIPAYNTCEAPREPNSWAIILFSIAVPVAHLFLVKIYERVKKI